jgi:transketolase
MAAYAQAFPDLAEELKRTLRGELPKNWDADMPVFPADSKGMATRVASGKVMNAIAPRVPALTGGSADLDPSTHTALKGLGDFNPAAQKGVDESERLGRSLGYAGATFATACATRDERDHQRHGAEVVRTDRPPDLLPISDLRRSAWRR